MIKKYIKTTLVEAMQVNLDNYEEIRVFVYPQRTTKERGVNEVCNHNNLYS